VKESVMRRWELEVGWRLFLEGEVKAEVLEGFFGQEQFLFDCADFSLQVLSLFGDLHW
jgi:hypothetical protein